MIRIVAAYCIIVILLGATAAVEWWYIRDVSLDKQSVQFALHQQSSRCRSTFPDTGIGRSFYCDRFLLPVSS